MKAMRLTKRYGRFKVKDGDMQKGALQMLQSGRLTDVPTLMFSNTESTVDILDALSTSLAPAITLQEV